MNWREDIAREANDHGDNITELIIYPEAVLWPQDRYSDTPLEGSTEQDVLDVEFDDGYGTSEGPAFTAWTRNRVYFPVVYDGSEWVGSVPRNPSDDATIHVGGQ